jgi:GxxExxY protein
MNYIFRRGVAMNYNEITGSIIDRAMHIHRKLGPGLLESVYRKVLGYELRKLGFHVIEEQRIPVIWENVRIQLGFRSDLIVNQLVIVETKSVDIVPPVYKKLRLCVESLPPQQSGAGVIDAGDDSETAVSDLLLREPRLR